MTWIDVQYAEQRVDLSLRLLCELCSSRASSTRELTSDTDTSTW